MFEFVWIRSASFGIFCFERNLEFLVHEDNHNHELAPLLTAVTEERWNSTDVRPSLRAKIIKLMALDRPGPSPNHYALIWVHGIPSFPDRHLLATSLEELLELTPKVRFIVCSEFRVHVLTTSVHSTLWHTPLSLVV